jgi:hypothetical protein
LDHIESVKGYFPMTHWRRRTQIEKEFDSKYDIAPDKSWVFLLVVGISLGALITGLLML